MIHMSSRLDIDPKTGETLRPGRLFTSFCKPVFLQSFNYGQGWPLSKFADRNFEENHHETNFTHCGRNLGVEHYSFGPTWAGRTEGFGSGAESRRRPEECSWVDGRAGHCDTNIDPDGKDPSAGHHDRHSTKATDVGRLTKSCFAKSGGCWECRNRSSCGPKQTAPGAGLLYKRTEEAVDGRTTAEAGYDPRC